jgi:hypothetical protein
MLLRDMHWRSCRKGSLWGRDRLWMPLLLCVCGFDGYEARVMQYVHMYGARRMDKHSRVVSTECEK